MAKSKKKASKGTTASKGAKRSTAKKTRTAKRTAKGAATRPASPKSAAKKSTKSAKKRTAKKTGAGRASGTSTAAKSAAKRPGARKAAKTSARAGGETPSAAARVAPMRARRPGQAKPAAAGRRANIDRDRRTWEDDEEVVPSPPSSLDMDRTASSVRTGRAEYEQRLRDHTSTGPAMTGGDVDADWEDAETVGDEAPGGDNPTPDQDIVDEIGKAMGIEYDDDEELRGGDELVERDKHRWELDPASKEDFEDE